MSVVNFITNFWTWFITYSNIWFSITVSYKYIFIICILSLICWKINQGKRCIIFCYCNNFFCIYRIITICNTCTYLIASCFFENKFPVIPFCFTVIKKEDIFWTCDNISVTVNLIDFNNCVFFIKIIFFSLGSIKF